MSEEEKLEILKDKFLKYHLEYKDEEMLFEIIDKLLKENKNYKELILIIKEKLNNIGFEIEQSWRKIEKLESKYE